MKQFFAANSFVVGIGIAVLLAWIAPEIGAKGGSLPVSSLISIGIFGIFFLQGASLPLDELKKGLADWKLHLSVQTTTFIFFPLVTFGGLALASTALPQDDLRLGFLYLSFLPTTIASAIALTATSNGNVSGALFNTTLSNVGGIFLVPFLCLAFLGFSGTGSQLDIGPILLGIFLKIVLPLLIGQCLRFLIREWVGRHKIGIRRFNNGVILFIVYSAFCDSFTGGVWSSVEGPLLLKTLFGVALLLFISSLYAWFLSGAVKLDPASRVAALLCGSQKTLAVGLPLSVMIFGTDGSRVELSLVIVPLLIYHPSQLILGGWLSPRLARFVDNNTPAKQ